MSEYHVHKLIGPNIELYGYMQIYKEIPENPLKSKERMSKSLKSRQTKNDFYEKT
jgi:hypothetical protein